MNQSILFNDDMSWSAEETQLSFSAQSGGAMIKCYLTMSYLQRIGLVAVDEAAIIEFCQLMQFDIEEDAQQAIEDERLSDDNQLWLT
ncbi:MAG: DUF1488 family protein [Psychrobium sp.]|nr:DUF1488 family protein [Psychrobium sp.]